MNKNTRAKKPAGNLKWMFVAKSRKEQKQYRLQTSKKKRKEKKKRGKRMDRSCQNYHPVEYVINQREYHKFLSIARHDNYLEKPRNLDYMLSFMQKAYQLGDQKTIDEIQRVFHINDQESNTTSPHPLYRSPIDSTELLKDIILLAKNPHHPNKRHTSNLARKLKRHPTLL